MAVRRDKTFFGDDRLHSAFHSGYSAAFVPGKTRSSVGFVRKWVDDGLPVNLAETRYGVSVLHRVCERRDRAALRVLLAAGADPDQQNRAGGTALYYALDAGSAGCVYELLEHGADANLCDARGFGSLHWAVGHGFFRDYHRVVKALLAAGADPLAVSKEGYSVLVDCGKRAIFHTLYDAGARWTLADVGAREMDGKPMWER